LWIRFLRHGVIAPHLPESQYPTLYGVFLEGEVVPLKELWERPKDFELPHCLLLDREKRELHLCKTDHTTLLFALTEPEDEDHHSVYIDDHLMNSESENYKVPPREEELRAEVLEWLDHQFEIARGRATAACEMIVDKRA